MRYIRVTFHFMELKTGMITRVRLDHGRCKGQSTSRFFRQRVGKHGLTNIIHLKFVMTDQIEAGKGLK